MTASIIICKLLSMMLMTAGMRLMIHKYWLLHTSNDPRPFFPDAYCPKGCRTPFLPSWSPHCLSNTALCSFKERGARNALLLLNAEQRERGVVAASAGNHALGLAWHGRDIGIPVTVVMPASAPLTKVSPASNSVRSGVLTISQHVFKLIRLFWGRLWRGFCR